MPGMIRILVSAGFYINERAAPDQSTALNVATKHSTLACVRLLLELGADASLPDVSAFDRFASCVPPRLKPLPTQFYYDPLGNAVQARDAECMELLMNVGTTYGNKIAGTHWVRPLPPRFVRVVSGAPLTRLPRSARAPGCTWPRSAETWTS